MWSELGVIWVLCEGATEAIEAGTPIRFGGGDGQGEGLRDEQALASRD